MSRVAQSREASVVPTDTLALNGPESHGLTTWRIFLLMNVVWLAFTLYTNERVLAPDVMAGVVERTVGVELSVAQLDQMSRQGRWAYPLLPVLLAIRVGVVALALQLVSMLMAHALPYREAFRAGLWGYGAVAYGAFVRMLRLDLLPAGTLTRAELTVVPDSLAAVFSGVGAEVTVLSASMSVLSLHDAFWIAIITVYLTTLAGFGRRRALAIALGAWCVTAVARVGAQIFMMGIIG